MTDLEATKRVAERLGYTTRHVARLVADGQLRPALKLDGETGPYLFDPAEVDRFIAERDSVTDGAA